MPNLADCVVVPLPQDQALKVLRGAALLLTDVISECKDDPPEQLLQAAVLIHDNCLLVRARSRLPRNQGHKTNLAVPAYHRKEAS